MKLQHLVSEHAQAAPDALAVQAPDGCLSYGALDRLANRFARALVALGVSSGDRIGIWLEKSTHTVIAMQGALRLGAIYVPLDPLSPAARISTILQDCEVKALVSTQKRIADLNTDAASLEQVACIVVDGHGPALCWNDLWTFGDEPFQGPEASADEIAYILYTSGSTGKPKGVCISHRNALAFVYWIVEELQLTARDRLANHAPFHFDLSVFDLYGAFLAGATVLLIPDTVSYLAQKLVHFIRQEAPTIWYSVPSVLILMMEQGKVFQIQTPSLRAILFAGEPFPIKHLRRLYEQWSSLRLLNLYGPTETNVCTFYEVKETHNDWSRPVPIGKACSGDRVWPQNSAGEVAAPGEEGELMVEGPTVMVGYWGKPRQGAQPYATGDIVQMREDGNYIYIGRRDHMVKVRGYRIELGDINAALEEHSAIHEAAVAPAGTGIETRLIAFIATNGQPAPSLLELKRHCAARLPRYMNIDAVRVLTALPRTRNGKVDYRCLQDEAMRL
jgi:amino acid adenylation domain-containing protein